MAAVLATVRAEIMVSLINRRKMLMKVVDKSQNVETEFRCLELADIFKIDDRILMKVSGSFDGGA